MVTQPGPIDGIQLEIDQEDSLILQCLEELCFVRARRCTPKEDLDNLSEQGIMRGDVLEVKVAVDCDGGASATRSSSMRSGRYLCAAAARLLRATASDSVGSTSASAHRIMVHQTSPSAIHSNGRRG